MNVSENEVDMKDWRAEDLVMNQSITCFEATIDLLYSFVDTNIIGR
jgi:hypothetical protein